MWRRLRTQAQCSCASWQSRIAAHGLRCAATRTCGGTPGPPPRARVLPLHGLLHRRPAGVLVQGPAFLRQGTRGAEAVHTRVDQNARVVKPHGLLDLGAHCARQQAANEGVHDVGQAARHASPLLRPARVLAKQNTRTACGQATCAHTASRASAQHSRARRCQRTEVDVGQAVEQPAAEPWGGPARPGRQVSTVSHGVQQLCLACTDIATSGGVGRSSGSAETVQRALLVLFAIGWCPSHPIALHCGYIRWLCRPHRHRLRITCEKWLVGSLDSSSHVPCASVA